MMRGEAQAGGETITKIDRQDYAAASHINHIDIDSIDLNSVQIELKSLKDLIQG